MDKNQAKTEIDKLKQNLVKLKESHKRDNDNNKYQLDGLKKSASIQTNPAAKNNAKNQIASKKDNMARVKIGQANEVKRIQEQIERIKNSIK
jgi:hypothetical protein